MLSAQSQLKLLGQHAAEGQDLSSPEIEQALHDLLEPQVSLQEKAEFLLCLARKGETAKELAGFAIIMRGLALDPQIDPGLLGGILLDTCGTGADRTHSYNISTATAFVLAAAGIPVAKHGNRSISSKCGSADVLEALGVKFEISPSKMKESLEKLNIAFLYAPQYHKTFKILQPLRQHLSQQGHRTIFNLLGPLVNPARPNIQMVGVYDPSLTELYVEALQLMKVKRAVVVHGYDSEGKPCMDELSTFGRSKISQLHSSGNIETFDLDSTALGLAKPQIKDLQGGDVAANAAIIEKLLAGKDDSPRCDILVYNASVCFVMAGQCKNIEGGIVRAREIIKSGAPLAKLHAFRDFTRS